MVEGPGFGEGQRGFYVKDITEGGPAQKVPCSWFLLQALVFDSHKGGFFFNFCFTDIFTIIHQDNRLRKGDQLIAVDNQPVVGLTHAEVKEMYRVTRANV